MSTAEKIAEIRRSSEKKNDVIISLPDLLKDILITEPPPQEEPILEINGVPVATAGNHSLLVGKKKSRKTLFIVWLIAQYKVDIDKDVLFFDTEQGKQHVWMIRQKVYALTGKWIPVFFLRGKSPKERRDIIEKVVMEWETKPKLVFIDGIRDLLGNINDADQTTELLTWVESLTLLNQLHIVNVLHLNKTDNNARGHLGSELLNKAQTTIELELDEKAGCTIVKCESSRDLPFESFAFTHGDTGLPIEVNTPVNGQTLTGDEERNRLVAAFDGDILKYAEAVKAIGDHFEVGKSKAEKLLAKYNRQGWIVKEGKTRSPNVQYKLMI